MPRRALLLSSLVAFACVHQQLALVPAPDTPQTRGVAFAEVAGVRAWADGRWAGAPWDLPEVLTPVTLTLENRSGRAVRLAYEDFSLLGSSGTRYAALPPFSLEAPRSELAPAGAVRLADYHPAKPVRRPPPRPVHPRIHTHRFWIAPPYGGLYVGFPLWPSPWAWNAAYYAQWSTAWPGRLPSEDMVQRALPEGALEDGGVVAGALYFQYAGREATVQLQVALHDAKSGEALGTLSVPFVVQR